MRLHSAGSRAEEAGTSEMAPVSSLAVGAGCSMVLLRVAAHLPRLLLLASRVRRPTLLPVPVLTSERENTGRAKPLLEVTRCHLCHVLLERVAGPGLGKRRGSRLHLWPRSGVLMPYCNREPTAGATEVAVLRSSPSIW